MEQLFFWANDDRLMRFVAVLRNPSSRSLQGVTPRWVAYDAQGVIVGGVTSQPRMLPAGAEMTYVGGAGSFNLTGVPASVEIGFADVGTFTVDDADTVLEASEVTFERAYSVLDLPGYRVYGVFTTAEELSPDDLVISVVMYDATGAIVGADFDSAPTGLPDPLPAGAAFRAEIRVTDTTAPPASARMLAEIRD